MIYMAAVGYLLLLRTEASSLIDGTSHDNGINMNAYGSDKSK